MGKDFDSGIGKSLKEIIYAFPEGVMVLNRDLCINIFNSALEELTGFSFNQVKGRSILDIFFGNPDLIEVVKKAMDSGITFSNYETSHVKRDKSRIPVSITASPLLNNKGKPKGLVVIIRDISIIKELEERAANLGKMQISRTLVAGMVHEIRNPLGGIRGAAQLLLEEIKGNKEQREYINIIIQEVERLSRLTDSLMELTTHKKLPLEPCNIHSILDQVLVLEKAKGESNGITFNRVYDPSLPEISASRDRLFQVFYNIIKNSLEELGEKGSITLRTKFSQEYHPISKDFATKQYILVEIQDTGKGIAPEIKKSLFTPFCTTKPKGIGLGLALSLKIIEEHNGFIKVESEEGRGTIFKIYLPRA